VGCSTSSTTDGTGVCSAAACQLAVPDTGARRDRRRVGTCVLMFYILFFFLLLCKLCFYVKKYKIEKNGCAAGATSTQTDARSILTI
jgi:hypothetical protein